MKTIQAEGHSQLAQSVQRIVKNQIAGNDNEGSGKRNREVSYVLINPSASLELRVDDVVFIIRPSGGPKTPSPMPPRRKFSSRRRPSKSRPVEPKLAFQAASPVKTNNDTRL